MATANRGNLGLGRRAKTAARAGICVALVVLGITTAVFLHLPRHMVVDTGPHAVTLGPITSRASFVQELDLKGPLRISSVEVLLATWGRPTNTTHDAVRVFAADGTLLRTLALPPGSLKDNTYARVDLGTPLAIGNTGKLFVQVSSSDGSVHDSITAWATLATVSGHLYSLPSSAPTSVSLTQRLASATPVHGAMCIRVLGEGPRAMLAQTLLRVGGLLVFLALAAAVWWGGALVRRWLLARDHGDADALGLPTPWYSPRRVPQLYLAIALVWGIVLVFVTPPLQTFDELAHYYRAWSVAEGQVVVPSSGHIMLPEGADALTNLFPTGPIAFRLQKVTLDTLRAGLGLSLGSRSVTSSSYASTYGPIGYLPQAVGIAVIHVVRGPPLLALYLARMLNLIAAVLLTYFGLRLLPFSKLPIAFLALLPMSMMEMGSLSPDALLLGGCVFFFGLVVACSAKDRLSRRDIALLVFGAVVLLNAKPGYAILSLLLLLLLPRQFASRLVYAATVIGSIAVSGALALLFMRLAPNPAGFVSSFLGAGNHVNSNAQLSYVATHPFAFVNDLGATINAMGVFLLRQSVAAYAWGQLNIGDAVMLVAAAGIAAVLTMREDVAYQWWRRAVMLGIAAVTAVGVSLGLYMGWSAVGAHQVSGLQGRYFLPCFMLGFIGLAGFPFKRRWLVPAIVGAVVLILIVTNLRTLFLYYY